MIQHKRDLNAKRKKNGADNKKKKTKLASRETENKDEDSKNSTALSDSDRKMLERWEQMRKQTKPFIHPIRNYMKELSDLKEEVLSNNQELSATAAHTVLTPGNQIQQQFHFKQFVPQDPNGNVVGLKAVKVPSQRVSLVTNPTQDKTAIGQPG